MNPSVRMTNSVRMTVRKLDKLSRMFQPVNLPQKSADSKNSKVLSKSYTLMTNYGFIKPLDTGMYALLPLGLRVLEKLISLVEREMMRIEAQKILLPALTPTKLWLLTKRYEENQVELFDVKDRHDKKYILSPTYEEAICKLVAECNISQTTLPLRLYQISSKWRDEMKPRFAFLRSREFVMKDLYTFDSNLDNARKTYDIVSEAYNNIFKQIGIEFVKVVGNTGNIGGILSHEYHYLSPVGEDVILSCPECQYQVNMNLHSESQCPQCNATLSSSNAIEVGHLFLLDTKYSKPLKAHYLLGGETKFFAMGCFGLGLSRIVSSVAEILSTDHELKWPRCLAPYTVCIIPPKLNSIEESASQYIENISEILDHLNVDVALDDRTDLTIGKRMLYARATGYPYVIVIGKKAMQSPPLFEIHNLLNLRYDEVSLEGMTTYFTNICRE